MGSMTTTTTAKEKLIQAAYELMLPQGYAATSVDQLCSQAGVSKGSFYHFFPTKEDLGLALLDDFFSQSKVHFLGGDYRSESDPLKRLVAFLKQTEGNASMLWSRGCLLGNFSVELSDSHPAVRKRVSEILAGVTNGIAEVFEPIGKLNPDNEDLQPNRLAEAYVAIIEGAIILSRAHDDWSYLQRSLRGFRNYIESLID